MTTKTARYLAPLALVCALGFGPFLVGATDASDPGATVTPATPTPEISQPASDPAPSSPPSTLSTASAVPAPLTADGLDPNVVALAEHAIARAGDRGLVDAARTLTVIDYSLPSTEKRLWVFDLESRELLFHELVAHGKNTGDNLATRFSNTLDSKQTSLGLFKTANTYVGSNGYSLRLDGLDRGFNDRARERAIVIHGAPYVSAELARRQGRIGRSWGCPALDQKVSRQLIDTIAGDGLVYAYHPQDDFLRGSELLAGSTVADALVSGISGSTTALAGR
ncbi:MAG TPA: murein L,D-transpeptidase catalytic domain family protein [Thermoanaerobaculia bacterium]|nr:murein L,D-transpeptidase catalytic domain family protein [Thermoanaerobaculia bacterium]